jgi:hypothetical protein
MDDISVSKGSGCASLQKSKHKLKSIPKIRAFRLSDIKKRYVAMPQDVDLIRSPLSDPVEVEVTQVRCTPPLKAVPQRLASIQMPRQKIEPPERNSPKEGW